MTLKNTYNWFMLNESNKMKALRKMLAIKNELFRRESFDSFEKFLLYLNSKFWKSKLDIPEFRDIVHDAELLGKGFIDILMISLPAGFGKSYLRECWNAWVIGRDINNTILVGTYSDSIAKSFTNYFKNIINDEKYIEVFGQKTFEINAANQIRLKGTTLPYTHFTRGAGGSITGNRAKYIQVDDLIKDFEESQSEITKQKRWDWYTTTLSTRKSENTLKEFWCGTRWSKDDPIGKKVHALEMQMASKVVKPYKVKIHKLPALKLQKVIIDNKEVIQEKSISEEWTTTEELLKIKAQLSDQPEIWEALYQQNPIDSFGSLFPESKIQTYEKNEIMESVMGNYGELDINLINPKRFNVFTIADVADTGSDYHAVPIIAYHLLANQFLLIDVIFTQEGVEITAPLHADKIVKYKSVYNRIEKNSFGKAYGKDVQNFVGARAASPITLKETKMNKEQKIYLWSSFILKTIKFRSDWKLLPESHPYKSFMKQLISYDKSGKNKHDDAADALSMAAQTISEQFHIVNSTLDIFNKNQKEKIKDIER